MAEDAQRSSDQRLRAAVESSPSGLLMIDMAGRIVLVNREVACGGEAKCDRGKAMPSLVVGSFSEPERERAEVRDAITSASSPLPKPLDGSKECRDGVDRHVTQLL